MAKSPRYARARTPGPCKFCLLDKPLCESHLMPKGLYSFCRTADCDPLIITKQMMRPTCRQTQDYLLCADCEQLFNRSGENWVLPQLATVDGSFPFYSLLQKQAPVFAEPDLAAYAVTNNADIKKNDLIHFALGIFWKASVHSWKRERSTPWIDLGSQSEELRKYLRGEGGFPQNMALILEVSPPPVGAVFFSHPVVRGKHRELFFFYVPGMFFSLWRGDLTQEQRITCLVSNQQGPVVVVDTTQRVT
jgi:hypothetical protein